MTELDQDALRWRLRALKRDIDPARDLWPDIAARIESTPPMPSAGLRPRRLMPWAIAASVLLLVTGLHGIRHSPDWNSPPVVQAAVSMTLDYENALARMNQAKIDPEAYAALDELDHSAAQILAAIDRDQTARFLLDQLRRTYARRLQLTQRAIII